MRKVLTIAGSDCSGGAGIQADIKTITAHHLYAMSAITALTAQNTTGVYGVMNVSPDFLCQQLKCIFDDIFPDAVKIGMVSNAELIEVITEELIQAKARNIVLDPVMISTSGRRLLEKDAAEKLMYRLLPVADLITPNLPEAEQMSGMSIRNEEEMKEAAKKISSFTDAAILVKGGHLSDAANDLLYDHGQFYWFWGERIENPNTHGTGCTLSSAIASNLAIGYSMYDSIQNAKDYLTGALRAQLNLGKGNGPLNHCWRFTAE